MFWVPPEARWSHLQNNAKQPTIGKSVDDAMDAIERAIQQYHQRTITTQELMGDKVRFNQRPCCVC